MPLWDRNFTNVRRLPLSLPRVYILLATTACSNFESPNEAMMKITASIDANIKSMDNLITTIGRKG